MQWNGWEWRRQRVQAVESDLNDDATLPVSIHIPTRKQLAQKRTILTTVSRLVSDNKIKLSHALLKLIEQRDLQKT